MLSVDLKQSPTSYRLNLFTYEVNIDSSLLSTWGNGGQGEDFTCRRVHTQRAAKPGLGHKCCCSSLSWNMAHNSAVLKPAAQFRHKTIESHLQELLSSSLGSDMGSCLWDGIMTWGQMPSPGSLTSQTLINPLKMCTLLSAILSLPRTRSNSGNVLSAM